ncbi:MAG: bifunctional 4'-phosphopantothenoylcysteine decarboxylase/phosphopantothenoylcysteine synthetase, partial [Gammaproteobacteria bacterium]|nr:bifunctional 4'-phosphopantothenoylcysteine decarboxylase/phosphopantothenoylcysteine synthetase [Gammaproteobacteria bacterium]
EQKDKPFCVGFAAETTDVVNYAKEKLIKKNLDMICANDVSDNEIGFNGDNNQLTVIMADGQQVELPKAKKRLISQLLIKLISEKL